MRKHLEKAPSITQKTLDTNYKSVNEKIGNEYFDIF